MITGDSVMSDEHGACSASPGVRGMRTSENHTAVSPGP